MPPGTGDIQLTLAQIMNISAAIIVTTPQKLSFVDVVKGIDMFDTVNVPSIAVVENMAEYITYDFPDNFYDTLQKKIVAESKTLLDNDSDKLGLSLTELIRDEIQKQRKAKRVFGNGHIQRLKDMWGMENLISLPLVDEVSRSGDSGRPYVLTQPNSEIAKSLVALADGVEIEVKRLKVLSDADQQRLYFNPTTERMEFSQKQFSPYSLRCDCRCAVCVEELTGAKLLDTNSVPKTIKPLGMAPIGRYAISVDWSDGHKSLYPFRQIVKLAEKEDSDSKVE